MMASSTSNHDSNNSSEVKVQNSANRSTTTYQTIRARTIKMYGSFSGDTSPPTSPSASNPVPSTHVGGFESCMDESSHGNKPVEHSAPKPPRSRAPCDVKEDPYTSPGASSSQTFSAMFSTSPVGVAQVDSEPGVRTWKPQTMTISPLLLPPSGIPNGSAHRLASLYFAAIMKPWYIPEFRAEYIFIDGKLNSILLTLKNGYDADRLKEIWDATDRQATPVPDLARISLNRGNTSGQRSEKLVQSAALEELASYRFFS